MHPVDHAVADVHRVGAVGQHVHLEPVAEARRVERLRPPARALEQRLLHVFGRARVHVVLNRLHDVADVRVRIRLLETMAAQVADDHGIADGHAVVDVTQAAVARARIVDARLVVAVRQLDERRVLAQRDRVSRRRHARDRAREEPAAATAAARAYRRRSVAGANRLWPLRGSTAASAAAAPAGGDR